MSQYILVRRIKSINATTGEVVYDGYIGRYTSDRTKLDIIFESNRDGDAQKAAQLNEMLALFRSTEPVT